MIFHQNLQQQLSGNNMKIHKNQIFCFFFLIIVNISYSQNKVKFGYHTPTGEVISLDTQQIKQILQPNKSLPIDNEQIDSVLNDSDSIFTSVNDTLTISVLLPFYLSKNDILKKYLQENKKDINQIYNKSKLALSFLEGILIAKDSLEQLGTPLIIHVFDTENNLDTVKKIITDERVKSSNILFGPVFSKNFNHTRSFFRNDSNKILINPLSKNYNFIKETSNIYFLTPFTNGQTDSIVKCLIKKEQGRNLTIILNNSENKKSSYFEFKNRLSSVFPSIFLKEFKNSLSINIRSFTFLSDVENTLVILSEDKAFIKKVVTFCGAYDSSIKIYSLDALKQISELNIETLMKLNVRIPVTNYFDRLHVDNKRLLHDFEKKFHHQMDEYSLLSFQSILHFCSKNKQFTFKRFSKNGGYINTDIKMCEYKDYKLIPVF
mgnify:CR=1 FL=1|tara:strand:+ start:12712 stop:14013 length:1302 start_codon:yes stop_codon:yes gene_type:complete